MHQGSFDRRDFLKGASALAAAVSLNGRRIWGAGSPQYPANSLEAAFELAQFDPSQAGSETIIIAADCHYGKAEKSGLKPIIAEVNAMRQKPAFFLVDGDLVCTISLSFGHRPNAKQMEIGRDELRAFQRDAAALQVPLKVTLGNHDTHPGETDPEIFWSVFPDTPAYSSCRVAGVDILLLNGHSDGNIDPVQRKWLSREVAKANGGEMLLFVHQPALGSIGTERGIPVAINAAFANYERPVWLVGGHHHRNHERLFRLPKSTIVQQTIVCSADGIWGGPEKPGYWIYCLRGGKVQARIFRRLQHGYRIAATPSREGGTPIPEAYDGAEGLLWKVFVGEGDDAGCRVKAEAGDVGSWLSYVKDVTYRLPLTGHGERPTRFGLLGTLGDLARQASQVQISRSGQAWEDAKLIEKQTQLYLYEIPTSLRGGDEVFVRCISSSKANIAGFSLWT